jgi:hypothetical protein
VITPTKAKTRFVGDNTNKGKKAKGEESKARKGPTEKRAGSMACSVEAFFCLDFLVTFVSIQK